MSQPEIYLILKEKGRPMNSKEIQPYTDTTRSNISYFLKRLYQKGCLDREWVKDCYMYSIKENGK